jgi:serine phosphatase RsbU (regulator of sigma subunit)/CHASE3 domain sensor protein
VSLTRRLIGVFLVYVAVLVIGGAAVFVAAGRRDDARDHERVISIALERISQFRVAFTNQEAGARGYLLTGEPEFLVTYDGARESAKRLLNTPELHVTEFASLTKRVERAWNAWVTQAIEPEIELRKAQGATPGVAGVTSGAGKDLFNRLSMRVAPLERAATEANADAEVEVDNRRTRLNGVFVTVLIAALVWTLAAALLVRRWVTKPLKELGTTVRNARSGELQSVVSVSGPVEIERLGYAIEEMRLQLVNARLDAFRAREAIEQSASVVFTLRSQLETEIGELPDGWTVAAELRPAEGFVAGDCYDVIRVDANHLLVVLVDIAGHGAVSGVLALRCKELLRAALRNGSAPGAAIAFASAQLDDLAEELFLSAFVAIVELDTGLITFANAGHPPGLLCDESLAVEMPPTGPIVGPFPDAEWETREATLVPGATLALYTDGMIEARDAGRNEFGAQRFADLVCGSSCDEAEAIAKRCIDEVDAYQSGRLTDDVTVVLVCRGPRA